MKIKPANAIPPRPPHGARKSSAEYMRWYRAARAAGLSTSRQPRPASMKKSPAERREWRRKYQREYRRRISNATAKGNEET